MRRLALALTLPVLFVGLVAAEPLPDEVPPQPTEFTFHGHGAQTLDEVGHTPLDGPAPMDEVAPTESVPKSKQIMNYVGGPNTECSGNNLFPTWAGWVAGDVGGQVTVSIPAIGNGGDVEVRLFGDVYGQACNEAFIPPLASAIVALPSGPGTIEATFTVPAGTEVENLVLDVIFSGATAEGRVLFDAVDYDATMTFTCTAEDEPGVEGEVCSTE